MRTSTLKSIAALALTGVGSALVLGFRTTEDGGLVTTQASGAGSRSGSTSTSGSGAASGSGSAVGSGSGSSSSSASTAAYKDGTWTGSEVSEPWGPFQVQIVISGGAITNVTVVESPTDRHSSRINNEAVPLLTEGTLASQNGTVDMVSGATWTSDSYATSLQSALDKAAQAS